MKNINHLSAGNYYLFESLSSSNAVFFNSKKEISIFRNLLPSYLKKFVHIHRVFIDETGYQILVRVRQNRTIKKHYIKECEEKGKRIREDFLKEPWRIISEKMRLFKSLFVRIVNKIRGREGVLVKHKFKKYIFESVEEYENYINDMEKGKRIESQSYKKYKQIRGSVKNWGLYRAQKWSKGSGFQGFAELVAQKLINNTFLHHLSPNTSNFPQ